MNYRIESDSLGDVRVPSNKYYGAQTQRSYENFKIGDEKFPREFIRAYGILKKNQLLLLTIDMESYQTIFLNPLKKQQMR